MSSRDDILASIRSANRNAGRDGITVEVPRDYHRREDLPAGSPALLELFVGRLKEYGAEVGLASNEDEVTALINRFLASCDTVVVPSGLPKEWVKAAMAHHRVYLDGPGGQIPSSALDNIDAVLTSSRCGVATTGTIILDATPDQGRRAITLVPDTHVVIVDVGAVRETVGEAFAILSSNPTRPITWIAGPSATSDIELSRVEGVHGPRNLKVILSSLGEK